MGITCNSSPTLLPPQPPSSKMKLLFILGLVALGQAVPQRFRQRQGRQEGGYLAPAADAYGAPAEDAPELYAAPEEPVADASELDNSYLAPAGSDVDNSYLAPAASEDLPVEADAPLDSYAAEEELGGYDADEEAQCQVFHICTADGAGGLAKYSFLCPNGTIFNQNYFICDWWFNVDCAESAALAEAKNSEIAAAREEVDAAADEAGAGGYLAPAEYEEYDDSQAAYGDAQASYERR